MRADERAQIEVEWERQREKQRLLTDILSRGRGLFGPSNEDYMELYELGLKHGREILREQGFNVSP